MTGAQYDINMQRNMNVDANANANANANGTPVAYQIDCQTTKKGKRFAGTKRRICWKFGFSNRDAVDKGLSGIDCRGEEHEVVFVWSLTSGKKFVLADGHEVHWSKQSPFSDKFECTWQSQNMAGVRRELTVVAHASSSLFEKKKKNDNASIAVDSSFRQFDLLIDGVSFSEMPKMFQLGLTKSAEDQRRMGMGMGMEWNFGSNDQQERNHSHDSDNDITSQYLHSSQPHLLPLQMQYQQQHQQQLATARCCMSPSQSVPDLLLLDSSSSPPSVIGGGAHFPHFAQQQEPYQISPTSVATTTTTTTNPFDMVAISLKPKQQQHTQYNNYYVPLHQ